MPLLSALLLLAFPLLTSAVTRIGDVFDVYTEDQPGSCEIWYDPHDEHSTIEAWWTQVDELNTLAFDAINSYENDNEESTRFEARSMFGIMWDESGKEPKDDLDTERLEDVQDNFSVMGAFLNGPLEEADRPKLFCDSTYRKLQKPNMHLIDLDTGRKVPKDPRRPNGPFKTLEDDPVFNFERYRYFYYDVPTKYGEPGHRERAYVAEDKNTPLDPIDSSSGQPSVCLTSAGGETSYAWHGQKSVHVILCMNKELKEHRRPDYLPRKVPKYENLGDNAPKSKILYHELWHVVLRHELGEDNQDMPRLLCRAVQPTSGNAPARFVGDRDGEAPHFYKWPEDRRSWGYSQKYFAYGPLFSSYIALYDRASGGRPLSKHEALKHAGKMATINPDNYVYFAMGVWLDAHTPHQWYMGYARDKGRPYAGPEELTAWEPENQDDKLIMAAEED